MSEKDSIGSYELIILLAQAFRVLTDELHLRLAKQGYNDVRPAHGFAFQLLSYGGATVNEIAEHLGITKQAASQMLDFLEQHGYVVRQPNTKDLRGKVVTLTEKGWGCIHATESIFAELQAQWGETIGADRLAQLRTDLRQLIVLASSNELPNGLRPVW